MNRGLVLTLCAAALAAGSLAQAQTPVVDLSLNLRYTNPNVPSQGGTWYLVAKTADARGVAGVNAYINNIASTVAYGTPAVFTGAGGYTAVTGANLAAELNNANQPFVVVAAGQPTNVVYFQDTANGPLQGGVGTATYAQRQATDPLRNTANWNNATVIASGTFAGGGAAGNQFNRPTFGTKGGNSTDANILSGTTAPANNSVDANVTLVVRGDSVTTLGLETVAGAGLLMGDRNRNGTVTFNADVLPAFNQIGTGSGKGWDDGDFNGNGTVTFNADVLPAFNNIGVAAPPAPFAAVPEPASIGLLLTGLGCLVRRRNK